MISFKSSDFHKTKDGGVYLKYDDIERLTEEIILDYDCTLLSSPRKIEYDDFLEGYLGVNLTYRDLYTASSDEIILGCTVFDEKKIPVFDRENMRKSYVECEPNTVIIDNSVVTGERKVQENITGLHESGHVWLHTSQLKAVEGQMSVDSYRGQVCCRKSDIEGIDKLDALRPTNAEMWREWQANVFAVTMALPKKSLDITVNELFSRHGIDTESLVFDADSGTKYLAEQVIPGELKAIYNMSKESIRYRLMKKGFYKSKKKYEDEHANVQMSLFDFMK
jgi:hypothetical protein